MHPLFGRWVRPFYEKVTTFGGVSLGGFIEITAFAGFSVLVLVWSAIKSRANPLVRFWIFVLAFFFVLTLGPALKICGLVLIPAPGLHLDQLALRVEPHLDPIAVDLLRKYVGIPLPYLLWHFIPILSGAESATRLNILVVLALSVLSAYGMSELPRRYTWAFFLILLFEYLSVPIPMREVSVPLVYRQIRQDPEDCAVLTLPLVADPQSAEPHVRGNFENHRGFYTREVFEALYYQTVHQKRLLGGGASRIDRNAGK
jgi:hypothetical protein